MHEYGFQSKEEGSIVNDALRCASGLDPPAISAH
jgi:hypothetical protein